MNKFFLLPVACMLIIACSEPRPESMSINGVWKFKTGDSAAWSDPAFNDSAWDTIRAGKDFESQGVGKYDGIAWYRKSVVIPSSMKKGLSSNYPNLYIILGKIDDADQVFLNGQFIGSTGSMEKNDEISYSTERKYLIGLEQIKWDAENVIAVRVNDFSGNGGLYKGPYEIHTACIRDYAVIRQDVKSETGVFNKGEKVMLQVKILSSAPEKIKGSILYTISRDTHEPLETKTLAYSVNKADSAVVDIAFDAPAAGFYQVNYVCSMNGIDSAMTDSTWFGYDPASLNCGTSRPADFEEYWAKAKKELAEVKPRFTTTLSNEWSNDSVTVYEVEMYSLGNVRVGGWYSVPKKLDKSKKLPTLLRQIGYSGNNMPVTDRPQFAVLSFNIRGHGNSKKDVNPGFPQYIGTNIDNKETYIYRGAYMDCIRAVDFLCSRPEVDTSRIAVYGGSQGGALSFATAALDSRVDLCAPHIPFLSDFRDYFKIVSFPRTFIEDYRKEHPGITDDQMFTTLDYIDIRNLAPWIHVPTFMGVGLIDRICPPHINFVAFNNIACPDKQWFVFKKNGHSVPASQHKAELEWIKMKFGMK